ncbi:hypothetical protein CDL15_Pgr014844 [Punica granatum]|uniref:Bifunctional inhibitor/plant lipid transfer protein/seed storage helical domain-containing protein n=1 Tax=Punica granatum TaxID=22663 RepID=A0A218Y172_PUNGR|nr:hypothetical protein CDL15_Pgr014844 [Punica granatum]PKI65367.1 hypothetical protein CRG98_014249 [Punica granatum]
MEGTLKIGFVLKAALLLVFLGLAMRTEAQTTNCTAVNVGIGACVDVLNVGVNIGINSPPSQACCEGLRNITQVAVSLGNTTTCNCIRTIPALRPIIQLGPLGVQLFVRIADLVQIQCRGILGLNANATVDVPLQCLG